ncbi:hypothetical protein [Bdellovibrio sp. KM01]|uniref:hypothetical protein n=1 Tax=Bdellovibrio sp. KM01 TaxID=2748865 RepID=UPI0015EA47C3|nr:hypothetical protein [Bdellovibrio sp. KM01]QLY24242.1 hypothetical protein HW988_12295 [Bdellovibrio sp. KM01]
MKTVLALWFTLQQAAAASVGLPKQVIVNPGASSTIASGTYEDIRIDADSNGLIDLWYLKDQNRTIKIRFTGRAVASIEIHYKRPSSNSVAVNKIVFDSSGPSFAYIRPLKVMNGEVCTTKDAESEIDKLTKAVSNLSKKEIISQSIDCPDEKFQNTNRQLLNAIYEVSKPDFSNSFATCMKGETIRSQFTDKNVQTDLAFVASKMRLQLMQISTGDASANKLFSCSSSSSPNLKAKYSEKGKITLEIPSSQSVAVKNFKDLIVHELVHKAGIEDEDQVEMMVSICLNNQQPQTTARHSNLKEIEDTNDKLAASTPASTKTETPVKTNSEKSKSRLPSSTANENNGEGVNIAKEVSVAEVKQAVPSADKLAVNSVNMTDEGKAKAVAASQRQSAPVFAMADRAMGVMNTPALASNDDSSSSSRSSSSRSSSDQRYQARHEGYESKSVADTNNNYDAQKGIYVPSSKNGMKVVEEVDLTRQTNAADRTGGPTATAANSRNVASTGRGTTAPRGSQATGEEQADFNEVNAASPSGGSGVSSGSGSGSGTFYSGGASDRKTNANTRRGVASGSSGTASSDSREEVLSRITGTSYKEVKSKLSTSEFKNSLVQNQIKIVDTYGNEIGASQARTIFLDDGSRFIMQRRK